MHKFSNELKVKKHKEGIRDYALFFFLWDRKMMRTCFVEEHIYVSLRNSHENHTEDCMYSKWADLLHFSST